MEAGPSHRPLTPDVTRLRDKPTQPALRCLSAWLLRNHGIFTGKPRPSLGPVLAPAMQCSNPWDHPHGKDFLLGVCLRREGKGQWPEPNPARTGIGSTGKVRPDYSSPRERTDGSPSPRALSLAGGIPRSHYADSG